MRELYSGFVLHPGILVMLVGRRLIGINVIENGVLQSELRSVHVISISEGRKLDV